MIISGEKVTTERTGEHRVQHITFTAETKATCVQSQLGGPDTHTALCRAPQYLLDSLSDVAKVTKCQYKYH